VVHRSGHEVSDALYRELRAAWDDGQIVEITLVIGMTEYFNRFNDSLRVAPTR
jgi:alkylhydroperoxidase family enzyme